MGRAGQVLRTITGRDRLQLILYRYIVLSYDMNSLLLLLLNIFVLVKTETWEKDMSDEICIEASHEGFRSIQLSCGKKRMVVEVKMEEDFDGIIYTRGSFMSK